MLGEKVGLFDDAVIDVSGEAGGGTADGSTDEAGEVTAEAPAATDDTGAEEAPSE